VMLTAHRSHAVRSPAPRAQAFPVARVAELRSVSSALRLSRRARRIARLLSCKATNHSHSLIEGGDLPSAISVSAPHETKGRNRQIVPKMGPDSHCENARQGSGCRTLRNPKVLARVSNGQREALRNWEDTVSGHKYKTGQFSVVGAPPAFIRSPSYCHQKAKRFSIGSRTSRNLTSA